VCPKNPHFAESASGFSEAAVGFMVRPRMIHVFVQPYLEGKYKAAFTRLCSSDPTGMNSPCVCATCPCTYLVDYINVIPEISGNHRLLRALSNGSDPKFLISPYGESSLREIPKLWNNILPEDLKVLKPTGHSGRTFGVSIALNNGGDSCKVKLHLCLLFYYELSFTVYFIGFNGNKA